MPAPTKFKSTKDISRKDILFCVARVPGTRQVFVGSSDGNVHHLDLAADKPESVAMEGHRGYVTGVALAGKQLVSGAYDGQLIWWDAATRDTHSTYGFIRLSGLRGCTSQPPESMP